MRIRRSNSFEAKNGRSIFEFGTFIFFNIHYGKKSRITQDDFSLKIRVNFFFLKPVMSNKANFIVPRRAVKKEEKIPIDTKKFVFARGGVVQV